MPGSIKIDDGSGNYTILTNAGSLGSDKTITIPNETGTIALSTPEVDQYLLTADGNADEDPIQDWARPTGTLQSHAGTGMSVSAGIFTFPKTGFWKVSIQARLKINSDTNSAYMYLHSTSNNGTAWDIILGLRSETGSATGRSTAFGTTFLDVTDLSNHKVKASFDELSNATIEGGTGEIATGIFFERLGDT